MSKFKLTPVVDTNIEGTASVSNSQQEAMNASPIEYTPGRGYAVVVQKAHQVPVTYGGRTYQSKRVFAVEVAKDEKGKLKPTGNLTAIKISAMRQTHFGEVKAGEAAPVIATYTNDDDDKLHMDTSDVTFFRAVEGNTGLACKDNTPFIKYPVVFWYTGQIKGYTPHFEENALQADNDGNLVLDETNINQFKVEQAGNSIDFTLGDIVDLGNDKFKVLAV